MDLDRVKHDIASSTNKSNTGTMVDQERESLFTEESRRGHCSLQEHVSTSYNTTSVINVSETSNAALNNVILQKTITPDEDKAETEQSNIKITTEQIKNIDSKEERKPLLNRRALLKEALTYELETFKKNILIIFNQENIDGYKPRYGTERDVEALTDTFTKFGFIIDNCKDFTKSQIIAKLKDFTDIKNDLSDYGCVAVAVLTHGSDNGLLRAKDMQYSETEIFNHFKNNNNETLVTKPKVIIIQACRGATLSSGAHVNCPGNTFKDADKPVEPYVLPRGSDMLILYSCYAGSPSHRHSLQGSWFIQELCKKINLLALTKDLEKVMREVRKEVALNKYYEEYNRRTLEFHTSKQMPVITSTLIRKLFLRKYGDVPPKVESFTDGEQENMSSESRNQLLYSALSSSPHLVTLEPGSSFVNMYSNFVKTCLKYYIEEKPNDEIARGFLEAANSAEDILRISNAASNYMIENAHDCQCFEQIHMFKY